MNTGPDVALLADAIAQVPCQSASAEQEGEQVEQAEDRGQVDGWQAHGGRVYCPYDNRCFRYPYALMKKE